MRTDTVNFHDAVTMLIQDEIVNATFTLIEKNVNMVVNYLRIHLPCGESFLKPFMLLLHKNNFRIIDDLRECGSCFIEHSLARHEISGNYHFEHCL